MKNGNISFITLFIFVVFACSGCTITPATNQPSSENVAANPTATSVESLKTPQPISTLAIPLFSPTSTATNTPIPSATITPTPHIWQIQICPSAPNIREAVDSKWMWEYVGDIEGRGDLRALLNFTKDNQILGYYFDEEQVREYKVNGCIEQRSVTMWLSWNGQVEAIIQGEFPETDPRSEKQASMPLEGEILTGVLTEKNTLKQSAIYLNLLSGVAGTPDHRFKLAGVQDDTLILNASSNFLAAVASDKRENVVKMIEFPLIYSKDNVRTEIQTPDVFLARYDQIFSVPFKARLAKTLPGNLVPRSGDFLGTISLTVYGGGGIRLNEYGKVTGFYDWLGE